MFPEKNEEDRKRTDVVRRSLQSRSYEIDGICRK
jgi:hypothetical protein